MDDNQYLVEDIFKEIEGDDDNVMLVFPPEVLASVGWNAGDNLNIEVSGQTIIISKVL